MFLQNTQDHRTHCGQHPVFITLCNFICAVRVHQAAVETGTDYEVSNAVGRLTLDLKWRSQEQRDQGLAELSTACAAREVAARSWLAGVLRTREQKPVLVRTNSNCGNLVIDVSQFYIRCGLVFAATLFATRYLYPVSMLYALGKILRCLRAMSAHDIASVVVTILRNSAGIGGVVGYIVSKLPRKSKTA